ncbi:MAG: hypothetical protein EON87_04185 [Brevundimonas sp.]|nr:MAG: hypothetical protein EON87_04185 [Brevundimonas sp.]
MAKGFEIETALGAPFSLAKRRPVSVFVWGVLTLLPIVPIFGMFIPVWAVAVQSGQVPDEAMFRQMMMANVFAQLAQALQWVFSVLVMTAAIRATLVAPKASPNGPFFLGFGMAELMVGVSYLALLLMVCGIIIVLVLVGVGFGFAVWGLGPPWNVLLIGLYGLVCVGAVIWVALRLSLVCVVTADRRTLDLPVAWRATKGQVGRLLLLCLLLWLASIAVALIFFAVMVPLCFGVFFLTGLRFEMFGHGAPLPLLTPSSIAILSVAGAVLASLWCWFMGLSQAMWASPFASVWKQMKTQAAAQAAKAADAAARDAIGSSEL